jgi:predicted O-methyltransferase YrrM
MEIGVADGENAKDMVRAASQNFPAEEVEYYGFDTFGWNDDSHIKEVRRKLEKTRCTFRLFKGDSVKTLPRALKRLPMMDLIFIDGGHSYETVKSDWENSKALMHPDTAVFFHNYNFSGPKMVVDDISKEEYQVKIIHPPTDYATAHVKKRI